MSEDSQGEGEREVENTMKNFEHALDLYPQAFPMPSNVLYEVTKLSLLIGCPLKEASTDDKPPLQLCHTTEIIPIDGFLGLYDLEERKITIFNKGIERASKELRCNPEHLRYIVRLHEWSHAILHLGVDQETADKVYATKYDPNNSTANKIIYRKQGKVYKSIENALHESLAQLLTYHSLKTAKENASKMEAKIVIDKMLELFVKLCKCQPPEYRVEKYLDVPLTRLSESIRLIRKNWLKGVFDAWISVITW